MLPRIVVIGVGNEFRRDDGIGPAVAAAVDPLELAGVTVVVSGGEPVELMDAWADADLAIVVDALRCAPPTPGRIHRIRLESGLASVPGSASSHGFGLPAAVGLAAALGRAPRQLVVFAVEAAEFGLGPDLSPPVSRAVPNVVRVVVAEIAAASADVTSAH
jgi:hydrogenase maturation protease